MPQATPYLDRMKFTDAELQRRRRYFRITDDDLERLAVEERAQALANPLSQEMAWLRTSLLPGLLRTASANLRHQQSR